MHAHIDHTYTRVYVTFIFRTYACICRYIHVYVVNIRAYAILHTYTLA